MNKYFKRITLLLLTLSLIINHTPKLQAEPSFFATHKKKIIYAVGIVGVITTYYLIKSQKSKEKDTTNNDCLISSVVGSILAGITYCLLGNSKEQASDKSKPDTLKEETLEAIMKYAIDYAKPIAVPTQDNLSMLEFSILLDSLRHNLTQTTSGSLSDTDKKSLIQKTKSIIDVWINDPITNRSIGALVGNALGDSIGAPLEFIPADNQNSKPRLEAILKNNGLSYINALNNFDTKPGQWTDDFSMALCLADSLIINPTNYNGSDCRTRYCNWWYGGYNNAFRFDKMRKNHHSIGLGGNIAKSIKKIVDEYGGKDASVVSALFNATGQDAGNGSIMRNSPIAIRFSSDIQTAIKASIEQSLGTHPGGDAAVCCAFMTYLTIKAINKDKKDTKITSFLDATIQLFLKEFPLCLAKIKIHLISQEDLKTSFIKLSHMLNSTPQGTKEALWNWKTHTLSIQETLKARGSNYNGYPVNAGYLGSYCIDGIAMALWALYQSTSFESAIIKCVNLLGDADSTGAICGQIAGAFYGYTGMENELITKCAIDNMSQWDPYNEIILRGLMLCLLNKKMAK